jgi:hypothetical protein
MTASGPPVIGTNYVLRRSLRWSRDEKVQGFSVVVGGETPMLALRHLLDQSIGRPIRLCRNPSPAFGPGHRRPWALVSNAERRLSTVCQRESHTPRPTTTSRLVTRFIDAACEAGTSVTTFTPPWTFDAAAACSRGIPTVAFGPLTDTLGAIDSTHAVSVDLLIQVSVILANVIASWAPEAVVR